jgi:maltose alpha-D-glucosyltransferase/alpha-amylase
VLVMRYDWDAHSLIVLHNFSRKPRAPQLAAADVGHALLVDLLAKNDSRADANGRHTIELPPYGYRWYRAGGIDRNVSRSDTA